MEHDSSSSHLLQQFISIIRPERRIPAKQCVRDNSMHRQVSLLPCLCPEPSQEASGERRTYPILQQSTFIPCGFPCNTSGAAYPKLPAASTHSSSGVSRCFAIPKSAITKGESASCVLYKMFSGLRSLCATLCSCR